MLVFGTGETWRSQVKDILMGKGFIKTPRGKFHKADDVAALFADVCTIPGGWGQKDWLAAGPRALLQLNGYLGSYHTSWYPGADTTLLLLHYTTPSQLEPQLRVRSCIHVQSCELFDIPPRQPRVFFRFITNPSY